MAIAGLLVACGGGTPDVVPYERLEVPEEVADDATLTAQQRKLDFHLLDVPVAVTLGGTLRYVVELTNESGAPVFLEPCPAYYQAWGESGFSISRTSYLNCGAAPPEIAPGESLRFEMELPIEGAEAVHVPGSIVWYLGTPGGDRIDLIVSDVIDVVDPGNASD